MTTRPTMPQRTVLITGASRGIGLAFVEKYLSSGWRVIAAVRNVDKTGKLHELAPLAVVQLDVCDEDSILQAARELGGHSIDLLINNAGVLYREVLENTKKADLLTQFEVNAIGPFLVTRAFHEHLKNAASINGIAKVLNISSLHGSIASIESGGLYGYRASKAALNMINKSLSLDLKGDSIAVVVASPGYVATDMNSYQGALQAEDSVAELAALLEGVTLVDTGKFYDRMGKTQPW